MTSNDSVNSTIKSSRLLCHCNKINDSYIVTLTVIKIFIIFSLYHCLHFVQARWNDTPLHFRYAGSTMHKLNIGTVTD